MKEFRSEIDAAERSLQLASVIVAGLAIACAVIVAFYIALT